VQRLYSSTIEEGVWRYVSIFSQASYLEKKGNSPEKAHQIASCLRQAREYYQAANQATILTRPVLLYYGMLNLCNALILSNKPGVSLPDFPRHGVHLVRPVSRNSLLSLSCETHSEREESTFKHLLEVATKDRYSVSPIIDWQEVETEYEDEYSKQLSIAVNETYRVDELIVVIPELFQLVLETTTLQPQMAPVVGFYWHETAEKGLPPRDVSARLWIKHDRNAKVKKLIQSFQKRQHLADWQLVGDEFDVFKYQIVKERETFHYPDVRETILGEPFAMFITKEKAWLSEIICHFLLMFIFGSAARYAPDVWCKLMDEKVDERAIVEMFSQVAQVKLPLLVLRELRGELVYFRQT